MAENEDLVGGAVDIRLARTAHADGTTIEHTYDAVVNRLSQTIDESSGPAQTTSTYDPRDRLLTAGSTSFGWDANGNLAQRSEESFTWDAEQRLTSAELGAVDLSRSTASQGQILFLVISSEISLDFIFR